MKNQELAKLAAPPSTDKSRQMPEMQRALLSHPDPVEAVRMVTEGVEHEFDASPEGQKLAQTKLEAPHVETRQKSTGSQLDTLEKKQRGTKMRIKSAPEAVNGQSVPFLRRRKPDQVMGVAFGLGLSVVLPLGVANVYSNLLGSQLEVFEANPWLALGLSFILPIASLSLKGVTNFIELDTHRRRYALGVYFISFLLILIWALLFAQNFAGVSVGTDWDIDNSSSGTPFVLAQLLLELFCGAALALALEEIQIKYSPEGYCQNPEWVELKVSIKAIRAEYDTLHIKWCEMQSQIHTLEAQRAIFIQERVAQFINHQRRYQAL
jgi:hypothetical protein